MDDPEMDDVEPPEPRTTSTTSAVLESDRTSNKRKAEDEVGPESKKSKPGMPICTPVSLDNVSNTYLSLQSLLWSLLSGEIRFAAHQCEVVGYLTTKLIFRDREQTTIF